MSDLNSIGLDKAKSAELSNQLNDLLANYSVFYQNTRGFHWNIKGDKFFELHVKFEELYTDAQEKVDLIAERILTLQGMPYTLLKITKSLLQYLLVKIFLRILKPFKLL